MDLRKVLLIVFAIALPLISINIQRQPGESPWYFKPFLMVSEQVQGGYFKLVGAVRDTTGEYVNLINIKKDNRLLKARLAEFESKLASFEEVRLENQRLNTLLEFKAREPLDLVAARVVGFDLFAQYSSIRINRGTEHGILPGQAVVTPQGVVGTVLNVDRDISQVLVLTDRYSVLDAIVQRTRARGIVEGKTQTSAQLKYLQRTDDVQVGDLVVTSGLETTLPQGFPIGKVSKVEKKNYGITQAVEIEPMIDASQLEEVFIVRKLLHIANEPKSMSMLEADKNKTK